MAGTHRLRVVVIGGGHAGVHLTLKLCDEADVTLVDGKGFYEANWAAVRCPVEPAVAESSVIAFEDIPKVKDHFIRATATAVTQSAVQLSTGQNIPYDYLVFTFGTAYADKLIYSQAGTAKDRRRQFQDAHTQLEGAQSVLIIGGGPVGVEMAAEIAGAMPDKQVTLVNSGPSLLAGQPPKLMARALSSLQKQGVKVVLNCKASPVEGRPGAFKLSSTGEEIKADVTYQAAGVKPCSQWLRPQHAGILDERGLIKVDEYFKVEGHPRWLALGDCTNIPEYKLGVQAKMQAMELAQSLLSVAKVGPEQAVWTKHKPYCGMKAMVITLGKKDAVMHFNTWSIPWFIPVWLKSRDLFVGQSRKDIGLPAVAAAA